MQELAYYLNQDILGTKVYEWAIFLSSAAVFVSYIAYYKKHPEMFDRLEKKLGLEKKVIENSDIKK